jgi:hypothetical protein
MFEIAESKVEDFLPLFPDNYFDACLCDPPYLLQFMGKEFDKQHKKEKGQNEGQKMQAWHERWAQEVLRVLKPGAHMLAFGGTRTYHRLASAAEDVGFEVRDMLTWLHGQGFPKNKDTQLKPAVEPCVLVKKPGSVGKLNIDGCRISISEEDRKVVNNRSGAGFSSASVPFGVGRKEGEKFKSHSAGRWPTNLLLDEESAAMLDEQSGITKSRAVRRNRNQGHEGWSGRTFRSGDLFSPHEDEGGTSRFFYCAKVSTRERNLGGIDCRHPTLKPISLTTYLSRLLLPPHHPDQSPRRILIPFSGAGSEVIGALLAGWDYALGIEMDEEHVTSSRVRIPAGVNAHTQSQ